MRKLNLGGATLLDNTADVSRVRMENGIAVVKAVETHTSKNGNICAKVIFQDVLDMDNDEAGHHEYISMSRADRFERSLKKIVYLAKYAQTDEARQAFASLPADVMSFVEENGQPVTFETNDELTNIRTKFNDDSISFVWSDEEKNKTRYAVKFNVAPEVYIPQLINALSKCIGQSYDLELTMKDSFQRLKSINAPEL